VARDSESAADDRHAGAAVILFLLFLDLLTPLLDERAVEISHFSFQRNREHHGGVWPADLEGAPPIGQKLFALAELLDEDELADIQFWLVDLRDRTVLTPLGFLRLGERNFCGWATVPSQPFRLRAEGHYLDGKKFHVISAAQTPLERTLPPEISGSPADEKYRQLTASPAPIPIPHARVLSLRHHLDGVKLRLELEIEVTGAPDEFYFAPFLHGPSAFHWPEFSARRKYEPGRHHVTIDLVAQAPPKPGRYRVSIGRTDFSTEILLP
jgi:hypothetical protein